MTLSNVMPGSRIPASKSAAKACFMPPRSGFTPFIDRETIDEAAVPKADQRRVSESRDHPGQDRYRSDHHHRRIREERECGKAWSTLWRNSRAISWWRPRGRNWKASSPERVSGAEDLSREGTLYLSPMWTSAEVRRTSLTMTTARCIGNACLEVGGRLIEVDLLSHEIKYMAKASRMISEKLPCSNIGQKAKVPKRRNRANRDDPRTRW